jgi:hypothetical protein
MAKTATKTTKRVSKVSTAKGKGKPAKVTAKKPATKKTVVKKVKTTKGEGLVKVGRKPAKAKVTSVYGKELGGGSYRLKNWRIDPAGNEQFPDMVTIAKNGVFKRFVNIDKAVTYIDTVAAYRLINGGAKSVKRELVEVGLAPLEDCIEASVEAEITDILEDAV